MPVEKGVESVEELFLRALFASEELDVVNEQHVELPIAFSKADDGVRLQGVYVFVGEFFAGEVGDLDAFARGL